MGETLLLVNFMFIATIIWLLFHVLSLYRQLREQKQKNEATFKELQSAQRKLMDTSKKSAVAALSAGILHQISQPITAIHGFIRFMKKEIKENNIFYKPVLLMDEQATYLKEMLENLMELVRHRTIQKSEVDMNLVVGRAMNLLSDELRIRRIAWDMRLANDLPPVEADAIHLQQVFMNLAVNAMDALIGKPPGYARTLDVSTDWDKENNKVLVRFKDNGDGISGADRSRIFDPFFTTKPTGTGIGLALCHDLITEHGGTIGVLSGGEDGTVFTVCLPCMKDNSTQKDRTNI